MHAAGVPGSHVVVRQPPDTGDKQAVPPDVIKVAAGVAAFYSKSKTAKRVKVHVTQCGQVGKAKGAPAGQVRLKGNFRVLDVSPLDPARLTPKPASGESSERAKSKPRRLEVDPGVRALKLARKEARKRRWRLESKIEKAEARIEGIDGELASCGSDAELVERLLAERQELAEERDSSYAEWEQLDDGEG